METMKRVADRLLSIKSIVTIALTGVFCYLAVQGQISSEFQTIYATVIAFYFGTQIEKKSILPEKTDA